MRVAFFYGILLLVSTMLNAQSTPPRDSTAGQSKAQLSGTISGDSGALLKKAVVTLSVGQKVLKAALTDSKGHFSFSDLPPGTYVVRASKNGYVTLEYGQRYSFAPGKTIEVSAGQALRSLDIRLPRGGVINGVVTDEDGVAVADAQVTPMRRLYLQGQYQLTAAGRLSVTDDLGQFRVFGLAPGQYYLRVVYPGQSGVPGVDLGYAPIFYPNSAALSGAAPIKVVPSLETNVGVVSMYPSGAFSVTGTVMSAAGTPLSGGSVQILRQQGDIVNSRSAVVGQDGGFSFSGVSEGDYVVRAWRGGRGGAALELASERVSVSSDLENMVLRAAERPLVTAKVVIAPDVDEDSRRKFSPTSLGFVMLSMTPGALPDLNTYRVSDDWSVLLPLADSPAVPELVEPPPGWAISAVRQRDRDFTASGIEHSGPTTVDQIEIEVSNKLPTIEGLVDLPQGSTDSVSILLFPQLEKLRRFPSRYVRQIRSDSSGRFRIPSVLPGDYFIVALDYMETTEGTDPAFLASVEGQSMRLVITASSVAPLRLPLVRRQ